MGKFFLRPALMLAQPTKIEGKALADIHVPTVTPMSTINLQTISDIRLDFLSGKSVTAVTDCRQERICLISPHMGFRP